MDARIEHIIKEALKEDGYDNDVTTKAVLPNNFVLTGQFIAKASGVVSGVEAAGGVFQYINSKIKVEILRKSGSYVNRGTVIAYVQGPIKDILRGEQVALNIFQRMSGIATETNKFVQELHGTGCAILGTRNTTPLLRALEKQAVIDGGGQADRLNLSDRIVITANHVSAVGGVKKAAELAASNNTLNLIIEVEVENEAEMLAALDSPCDSIILSNMTNEELTRMVVLNQGRKKLIAQCNPTLKSVRSIALTGVDYIALDSITNSCKALDIIFKISKLR